MPGSDAAVGDGAVAQDGSSQRGDGGKQEPKRDAGGLDRDAGSDVNDGGADFDAMPEGGADAGGTDGSAEADAAEDAEVVPDPPLPAIVEAESGFVEYGTLEITFAEPVDADTLQVGLKPARPLGIVQRTITQLTDTSVSVQLSTNHIPIDYTVQVRRGNAEAEWSIAGETNGARTAFGTRAEGTGNLRTWIPEASGASRGRDAGDIICQTEADAAGLKGTFRAYLSSRKSGDAYDAVCRILGRTGTWVSRCGSPPNQMPSDTRVIIGLGGLPIAQGASHIALERWRGVVAHYADGERSEYDGPTRTGSSLAGQYQGSSNNYDCDGYLSGSASLYSYLAPDISDAFPEPIYSLNCERTAQLLCIQQPASSHFRDAHAHEREGKAVFLTSRLFAGNYTDARWKAQMFCQSEAEDNGYPNSNKFIAWLSEPGSDAACFLAGTNGEVGDDRCGLGEWPAMGPFVRYDGTVVAAGMQELLTELRTPIAYDAAGQLVSEYTVTMTDRDGTADGRCSGGLSGSTTGWASYWGQNEEVCDREDSYRLICFER